MASFKLTTLLVAGTSFLTVYARLVPQGNPLLPSLPPTPKLPGDPKGSYTTVDGAEIWHAEFGTKSKSKLPVLMLHNALGSSDYWGSVVELIMKKHYVIVMDARGQGRSPLVTNKDLQTWLDKFTNPNVRLFSFDEYAQDAVKVLKDLQIEKAAWVGWDAGANTVLAALMNPKLAPTVDRAFTTGAWHNIEANNANYMKTSIFKKYMERVHVEYRFFQPNGNLKSLLTKWAILKSTWPRWTKSDLGKITLGPKLTLSWGEQEEAIDLKEVKELPGYIQDSKLVVMPGVSHFAPLQDATQFAAALETFLE
ncbi:putative alpha/beta fold hydrolase [Rhizoctonia solani 123E]|uniref:Putative alpha/beta fold hydrolase n=1 Tax=Rhizoctonia solani 123E TaxID=1423351 RepID=A0A074SNA7_9AGAM|nr:putative alpha/beta fold hydrolase [Rhizoctonia solani 123E]